MLEICIIALTLIADQWTKSWAARVVQPMAESTLPIWKGVFHFTYHENRGAAFGILQGKRVFLLIITVLAVLAMGYILFRYRKEFGRWMRVGLSLMISGAVGNFIDRVWLGYVRDFIDVRLIHFPMFNIADACLTISVFMIAIYIFFFADKEGKKTIAPPEVADE